MKKLLKLMWWWPLMLYGGKSVQAEDFKFLTKAQLGVGYNLSEQLLSTVSTVSLAEFGTWGEFRVGMETTTQHTVPLMGPGIKLKELTEALGAKWKLDTNISASVYTTVNPFDIPKGKGLWDTLKVGISVTLVEIKL